MSFKIGDFVVSKLHTLPSPIWRIARLDSLRNEEAIATLRLVDPQGWGPGPLQGRRIHVENLEHANEMLVIALAVQSYKDAWSQKNWNQVIW